jgi:hypothetical protein
MRFFSCKIEKKERKIQVDRKGLFDMIAGLYKLAKGNC